MSVVTKIDNLNNSALTETFCHFWANFMSSLCQNANANLLRHGFDTPHWTKLNKTAELSGDGIPKSSHGGWILFFSCYFCWLVFFNFSFVSQLNKRPRSAVWGVGVSCSVSRSIFPVFLCFKVNFGIFSGLLSWQVARKLDPDHLDSGLDWIARSLIIDSSDYSCMNDVPHVPIFYHLCGQSQKQRPRPWPRPWQCSRPK